MHCQVAPRQLRNHLLGLLNAGLCCPASEGRNRGIPALNLLTIIAPGVHNAPRVVLKAAMVPVRKGVHGVQREVNLPLPEGQLRPGQGL